MEVTHGDDHGRNSGVCTWLPGRPGDPQGAVVVWDLWRHLEVSRPRMAAEIVTTEQPKPVVPEHLALRPSWECCICTGQPWPCAPAKASLVVEHHAYPSVLLLYLHSCYAEALEHFAASGEVPADLYERFVTWARR
jgi:hypothetical protein